MGDDLPMGWELVGFPEVVFFQEGPGLRKYQYRESGIPFLNIRTFVDERIDEKLCNYLDVEEVEQKYKHFLVDANDILVATSGSIGKMAIAKSQDLPLMLNTSIMRFRPITEEKLERGFLYFFLKSNHFFAQAESAWTGTAQKNMGPSHVKTFNILLPPLNEQRRIVDKLERICDRNRTARNELNHIPKLIARYKQAVLAAACAGKLTEDWREANLDKHNLLAYPQNTQDKTSKISQTELSMSEDLYEIPQSWVWKSLSNVCLKITDGEHLTPPLSSEGIPLLSAKDVRNDYLDFSETKYISLEVANKSRSRCNPEIEDILVVSRGATIGRTCRVKTNKLFCLMGSVLLFKINTTIAASCFVELFLKSSFSADRFLSMSGASAQSAIYIRDMKIFPIPIPPLEEQKEIVRRVEKMFAEIDKMEAEYQKAAKLCDRLEQATLAKAFRGELLPQDPDDEPASVLLEQVKREKQVQPKGKSVKSK
jgi:type I restriction enzyme, S subunit